MITPCVIFGIVLVWSAAGILEFYWSLALLKRHHGPQLYKKAEITVSLFIVSLFFGPFYLISHIVTGQPFILYYDGTRKI